MAAYTLPFREALNESISSGRFVDTKIILFSQKDPSGTVCKPKALYASSHVLKTVPYFSDRSFAETEPKDLSEPVDESECADDYSYHSDSDLEEDDDGVNAGATLKKGVSLRGHPLDPFCFSLCEDKSTPSHDDEQKEHLGTGKVIKIRDVAFITFQAFLLYLYTGSIEFAPYGSKENHKSRSTGIVSLSEDSVPRPSSKSIYRLADKYDVPSLKQLALENIRNNSSRCDIVEEAFSNFSSRKVTHLIHHSATRIHKCPHNRYEEIRKIQIQQLESISTGNDKESAERLCKRIEEKVDSFADGNLDHAVDTIVFLWKLPRGNGRSPTKSLERSPPTVRPVNWRRVNTALIKSIREGVFLDRKYWAKHSKPAKVLRPFYISSIVAGEALPHIDGMVKSYQGEDEYFDKDNESEDSDCDSSLEVHSESTPKKQEGKKKALERESLPVATVGSFSSWISLFFYLCTDVIEFAPLKSEGTDARARHVQERTVLDRPPPCSPKTICTLATALDIKPLRDLAVGNIRSKLTPSIIVEEFFSTFTSKQDDIMKIQCEFLYGQLDNDSVTAKGVDHIESMLYGSFPHRAGALKLALRESLLGGVFLRCWVAKCDFHKNTTTTRRSLGSRIRCPFHDYPLECPSCEVLQNHLKGTSCKNCGNWFR